MDKVKKQDSSRNKQMYELLVLYYMNPLSFKVQLSAVITE
jgi:hypothetical protein